MAQVVNVNFRMDAELKKSMEEVCSEPFYSESNIKYLEKVISDIDEGRAKLVEHDIIEVDE